MQFADAHIHLVEVNPDNAYYGIENAAPLFSVCSQYGHWMSQFYTRNDQVKRFYGIHPWYADQWNDGVKRELRYMLERDTDAHIGEIGLDNKHENMDLQLKAFEEQVEIASELGRSINVHNLGCDGDIVRILKSKGKGCGSIILHSFKNPDTKAFSGLNCYFSVNERILEKSEENLREVLTNIPRDRLLVESDAPFVVNSFSSMANIINAIAKILGMTSEEVAQLTINNAKRSVA